MSFYETEPSVVTPRVTEGAPPTATLDPDIALWPIVLLSIWPFTGPPSTGTWPKGWIGMDNTATLWICSVGGSPGTWTEGGGGGSFGPLSGDVTTASPGSDVTTLVGTANVEDLIREQTPNQQNPPTAAVPYNNQRLTNIGPPLLSTDAPTALNALLASTYFEPSSQTIYELSQSAFIAIDTTNLTLSFTAISSAVVIELEGWAGIFGGTTGAQLYWGLLTHGTSTQVGYTTTALNSDAAGLSPRVRALIRLTGLNAGNTYQVDWAWGASNASDIWSMFVQATTGTPGSGEGGGPAVMRAFAG